MTGYHCKYAPIELLAGFGEEAELINSEAEDLDYGSSRLHPNMCSHAKAMLQDIHGGGYDGVIFVNCCDSSRRVRDAAEAEDIGFTWMMDLPSCGGQCAVEVLRGELMDLIGALEEHFGKKFDAKRFKEAFKEPADLPGGPYIALMGARSSASVKEAAEKVFSGIAVKDLTCVGNREVVLGEADAECGSIASNSAAPGGVLKDAAPEAECGSLEALMERYARALLRQIPCMRMQDTRRREMLAADENCKGIIYNIVQFCDYYDFEFSGLKNSDKPIIRVETDFTRQSCGQLLTRLEGFRETVMAVERRCGNSAAADGAAAGGTADGEVGGAALGTNSGAALGTSKKSMKNDGKYYIGIDSGSTTTELVALDRDGRLVRQVMVRTGVSASRGAEKALQEAGIYREDMIRVAATGYGRKSIDFADENITEITCHAYGAKHLYPGVRTIIDIGGQDSKVIRLDEEGRVLGFSMNDKCAAGTGRFLENMAKVLELDMDEMARAGLAYREDLTISSMCTVFAESEVVSLIADNHSAPDIVHGLNKSVASRTKTLLGPAKDPTPIMMTGGVANNPGVVNELEKLLGVEITIPEGPEYCGALGAALIAAGL